MALNLPFIAIQTADNQNYLANYLENNNFLLARTLDSNNIQTLIQSLIDLWVNYYYGKLKYQIQENISYISTGGGAFLEYVEGKQLPAVAILEQRAKS